MVRALMLYIFVAFPLSSALADVTGTARIIDGDTIEVDHEKVRLHGIDAPEMNQSCRNESGKTWECGREAKEALRMLTAGQPVTCIGDKRDRYRRLIAVCFAGGININEQIVLRGLGLAYRRYSMDYVAAEQEAQNRLEGIWNGHFITPWEWRRGKRMSQ